jgi:hypothetical protein
LQKNALLIALLHPGWAGGQAHALVAGLVGFTGGITFAAMVWVAGGIDASAAAEQLARFAGSLLASAGANRQSGAGQQNDNPMRRKTGAH